MANASKHHIGRFHKAFEFITFISVFGYFDDRVWMAQLHHIICLYIIILLLLLLLFSTTKIMKN